MIRDGVAAKDSEVPVYDIAEVVAGQLTAATASPRTR